MKKQTVNYLLIFLLLVALGNLIYYLFSIDFSLNNKNILLFLAFTFQIILFSFLLIYRKRREKSSHADE